MPDVFTKKERSRIMAAVHSRGNIETEIKLASILRSAHINGWRRHQPLPGYPDFTFRRQRVAIFVDGCFWHGCPLHCRMPQNNHKYWLRKIGRNIARDRAITKRLKALGWCVLRIWGHALNNPNIVINRIISRLNKSMEDCNNTSTGK